MNSKKVKYIVLIWVVFLVLLFFIRVIFKSDQSKKISKLSDLGRVQQPPTFPTLRAKLKSKTKDLTWERDPFFINKYIKPKTGQESIGKKELNLTGIIWDKVNPVAVISDQVVREGDLVERFKVKKIYKSKVILIKNGKKIELYINESR